MSRLIIIFALAGADAVLVLFANLLLVATNAGAQETIFNEIAAATSSARPAPTPTARSISPIVLAISPAKPAAIPMARPRF
jgi:cell division protein FtsN